MSQAPIAAILFDTETTGFPPTEVIELAWVEILDTTFERADNISCERFRPDHQISLGAISTHHILPCDLLHCPPSSTAAIPPSTYIIGHNIDFDWEVMGKPPVKRICTLALARRIWPALDSHKLTSIFYHLHGLTSLTRDVVRNAHSALHDVAMNHQVLLAMIEKLQVTSLEDLWKASESARIPTHMTFGKHKGKKISEVDAGWVKWYRAQAETDPYLLLAFSKAGK